MVCGRKPPSLIAYGDRKTPCNSLDQQLLGQDQALIIIKEQLLLALDRMKHYADKRRRDLELEVGDHIYLKLRPYRQKSIAKRQCE